MVRIPKVVLLVPVLLIWASHPARPEGGRVVLGRCQVDQPVAAVGLPPELLEVSGLAQAGVRVLAHNDEVGVIFAIDALAGEVVQQWELTGRPREDFEGIAMTGDGIALMTSGGTLFLARWSGSAQLPFARVETGFGRHCELEGLGYDPRTRVLLIPCKAPRDLRHEGSLIVLRWSLDRAAPADPGQIVTPAATLTRALGFPRVRPTAVEWDSVTGRMLVLSAEPQALLDVDSAGGIVAAVRLDPRRHPQPEGVTLVGDRLLIADEGSATRPGSLTSYGCRP